MSASTTRSTSSCGPRASATCPTAPASACRPQEGGRRGGLVHPRPLGAGAVLQGSAEPDRDRRGVKRPTAVPLLFSRSRLLVPIFYGIFACWILSCVFFAFATHLFFRALSFEAQKKSFSTFFF